MTLSVATLTALPAEEAHRAFRSAPASERATLAEGAPEFTAYLVQLYLYDPDHSVRAALLTHPHLPVRHQRRIATSSHLGPINGSLLAANPSLDVTVQDLLAGAVSTTVRRALATSSALAPSLHARLLGDASDEVVDALVGNPTFTLHPDIATSVLARTPRGARFTEELLADCDPATVVVLAPSWAGTLRELRAVGLSAGPH